MFTAVKLVVAVHEATRKKEHVINTHSIQSARHQQMLCNRNWLKNDIGNGTILSQYDVISCIATHLHALMLIFHFEKTPEYSPHGLPVRVGTPSIHFTLLDAVSLLAVYPEVPLHVTEYAAPCATGDAAILPMNDPPSAMLTAVTVVVAVHEATVKRKHDMRKIQLTMQ
jgi:hypothetical protein